MSDIEAADFHEISIPFSPRISPSGDAVAFVRRKPRDGEEYDATVYVTRRDGGTDLRRFSLSEGQDATPRWSPSGDRLAFTSTRGAVDDRQQLWVVPTDGGEGEQVTNVVGGVSSIDWSPDGTEIAFVQKVRADDRDAERDLEVPEEYEPEPPDPRVIERTVYRSQQQYYDDRRGHGYVVDLAAGENTVDRVTTGEVDVNAIRWADDETIYYTDEWVGDDPDDSLEFDVCRHVLPEDRSETVYTSSGWAAGLTVTEDGRLAVPYTEPERATLQQTDLQLVAPDGGLIATATEDLDRTLDPAVEPTWGPAESAVYFGTPDEGKSSLWRFDPETGGEPERVFREGEISGAHVGSDTEGNSIAAVTMSEWGHPGDVFLHTDDGFDRLTELNATYLDQVRVAEPERIEFESEQGAAAGWFLAPASAGPEDSYPLVVEVHGGPHSMWSASGTMWHEFQTLAARGYAVFWTNPRGSSGYGKDYMQAIERDWGDVTLTDVLAGVETVCDRDLVDEEEIFLTGGSFGGFMTGWAVGRTDRFEAAVAQRGVYDLTGFYGTTDGAYRLVEDEFDATPWEAPDFLWEQSPTSLAPAVETPTLVIHSDNDYRTPAATAELFYRILRKHEVETRMVRYPREGHELSRSGEPDHVVDRIERIVRWFDGYSSHHDEPPALARGEFDGLSATPPDETT